ncbi:MAG: hypothetical protein HQL77_18720 [Magnetococcales bacterium]|nr:hypothetical protein [Magnetococcales bacterium]
MMKNESPVEGPGNTKKSQRDVSKPEPVLQLSISKGPASNTKMIPWDPTFPQFCHAVSKPKIGLKDGSYFLRGLCDGPRSDANLKEASTIVLDGDATIDLATGEIKKGAPDPRLVHEAFKKHGIKHRIYTTYSHDPEGPGGHRYRVIIPSAKPFDKAGLAAAVNWLIESLHQERVPLANVPENLVWSQPWYFPRVPAEREHLFKFYQHDGQWFDLDTVMVKELSPELGKTDSADDDLPADFDESLPPSRTGPIGKFNGTNGYDWMREMLIGNGYVPSGKRSINGKPAELFRSPTSTTGKPGVRLYESKDGRALVYSSHGSDLLNAGDETPKSHDAFDLLTIFEFNGDEKAALASLKAGKKCSVGDLEAEIGKTDPNDREGFKAILEKIAQSKLDPVDEDYLLAMINQRGRIPLGALRQQIKQLIAREESAALTHDDMTQILKKKLTDQAKGASPVSTGASTWVPDETGLWRPINRMTALIAQEFNNEARCCRASDYRGIATHFYECTEDQDFFRDAPVGVTCGNVFYRLDEDGELRKEPLHSEHRQQFRLPYEPEPDYKTGSPNFMKLIDSCFEGDILKESHGVLQEVFGAVLFGLFPKMQKAILMKGNTASGKSTVLRILEELIPEEFRCAIDPTKWNSEYYVAHLNGKKLNCVGELSDDAVIPANDLKKTIGGDPLVGRDPTHKPRTFRNSAAHIFSGNSFPPTSERSEAFFRRWLCMEFPNTVPEEKRILGLAEKIIADEMPGIVGWAFKGARNVMCNGGVITTGIIHARLLTEWKDRASSIREFVLDSHEIERQADCYISRAVFYREYASWAASSGRKALAKQNAYRELESCSDMGIQVAVLHGEHVVKGLKLTHQAFNLGNVA